MACGCPAFDTEIHPLSSLGCSVSSPYAYAIWTTFVAAREFFSCRAVNCDRRLVDLSGKAFWKLRSKRCSARSDKIPSACETSYVGNCTGLETHRGSTVSLSSIFQSAPMHPVEH